MKRKLCSITIIMIIIILGLFKYGIALFDYSGKNDGDFTGTIYNIGKETNYMNSYKVKVNKYYFLLYVKKSNYNLEIGDNIQFTGNYYKADSQRNYKGFDYNLYLKTKKISGIIKTDKANKIGTSNSLYLFWKKHIYKTKMNILNVLNQNLKKENSALLSGILIGDDSNLSIDDIENFKKVNLTHMLAISGENFMYIILILDIGNKKIKLRRIGYYITIIAILSFMELTGNSASVIRAGTMCILSIMAKLLHRKYDIWTSLSISVLIQIVYNPYSIFDIGLLLSYGGVIGIIGLYQTIHNKLKSSLLSGIISANIIITPISIYNFNQFSLIFIISNFLASIFIEVLTITGFISIFIRIKFIFILLDFLLTLFRQGTILLASIPFSSIIIRTPAILSIIVYYIMILVMINKCKIGIHYKQLISICVCTIIILNLNFQTLYSIINQKLFINFVDVGQGDCTLIRYRSKNILIDGGGTTDENYEIGKNILIPYLLDRKVKKIDYVIISHFDTDHVGGIITVLEELKVNNIIISKQGEDSENYKKIKEISKRKKIKITTVGANYNIKKEKIEKQTLKLDKELLLDILWPNSSNLINENILNNNSIVCKLNYFKFSIMFTGDIEEIAEKQIIRNYTPRELESTMLKVAHHGSKTSSSEKYINTVKPKNALIGVGKDNKFGHPNDEVIERLKRINCNIYRTDLMGEISIEINQKGKIKIKNKIAISKT